LRTQVVYGNKKDIIRAFFAGKEIASRQHQIPVLLGMGYRSFSILPVMADEIRNAIAATDLKTCTIISQCRI